MHNTCFEVRLV